MKFIRFPAGEKDDSPADTALRKRFCSVRMMGTPPVLPLAVLLSVLLSAACPSAWCGTRKDEKKPPASQGDYSPSSVLMRARSALAELKSSVESWKKFVSSFKEDVRKLKALKDLYYATPGYRFEVAKEPLVTLAHHYLEKASPIQGIMFAAEARLIDDFLSMRKDEEPVDWMGRAAERMEIRLREMVKEFNDKAQEKLDEHTKKLREAMVDKADEICERFGLSWGELADWYQGKGEKTLAEIVSKAAAKKRLLQKLKARLEEKASGGGKGAAAAAALRSRIAEVELGLRRLQSLKRKAKACLRKAARCKQVAEAYLSMARRMHAAASEVRELHSVLASGSFKLGRLPEVVRRCRTLRAAGLQALPERVRNTLAAMSDVDLGKLKVLFRGRLSLDELDGALEEGARLSDALGGVFGRFDAFEKAVERLDGRLGKLRKLWGGKVGGVLKDPSSAYEGLKDKVKSRMEESELGKAALYIARQLSSWDLDDPVLEWKSIGVGERGYYHDAPFVLRIPVSDSNSGVNPDVSVWRFTVDGRPWGGGSEYGPLLSFKSLEKEEYYFLETRHKRGLVVLRIPPPSDRGTHEYLIEGFVRDRAGHASKKLHRKITLLHDPDPARVEIASPPSWKALPPGTSFSIEASLEDDTSRVRPRNVWITIASVSVPSVFHQVRGDDPRVEWKGKRFSDGSYKKAVISMRWDDPLEADLYTLAITCTNGAGLRSGDSRTIPVGEGFVDVELSGVLDPPLPAYHGGESFKLSFEAASWIPQRIEGVEVVPSPANAALLAGKVLKGKEPPRYDSGPLAAASVGPGGLTPSRRRFGGTTIRVPPQAPTARHTLSYTWRVMYEGGRGSAPRRLEIPVHTEKEGASRPERMKGRVLFATAAGEALPLPRGTKITVSQIYKLPTFMGDMPKYVEQFVGFGRILDDGGRFDMPVSLVHQRKLRCRLVADALVVRDVPAASGGGRRRAAVAAVACRGKVPYRSISRVFILGTPSSDVRGWRVYDAGTRVLPEHGFPRKGRSARLGRRGKGRRKGILIEWEGELSTGGHINFFGARMSGGLAAANALSAQSALRGAATFDNAATVGVVGTVPGIYWYNHNGAFFILRCLVKGWSFASTLAATFDRVPVHPRGGFVPVELEPGEAPEAPSSAESGSGGGEKKKEESPAPVPSPMEVPPPPPPPAKPPAPASMRLLLMLVRGGAGERAGGTAYYCSFPEGRGLVPAEPRRIEAAASVAAADLDGGGKAVLLLDDGDVEVFSLRSGRPVRVAGFRASGVRPDEGAAVRWSGSDSMVVLCGDGDSGKWNLCEYTLDGTRSWTLPLEDEGRRPAGMAVTDDGAVVVLWRREKDPAAWSADVYAPDGVRNTFRLEGGPWHLSSSGVLSRVTASTEDGRFPREALLAAGVSGGAPAPVSAGECVFPGNARWRKGPASLVDLNGSVAAAFVGDEVACWDVRSGRPMCGVDPSSVRAGAEVLDVCTSLVPSGEARDEFLRNPALAVSTVPSSSACPPAGSGGVGRPPSASGPEPESPSPQRRIDRVMVSLSVVEGARGGSAERAPLSGFKRGVVRFDPGGLFAYYPYRGGVDDTREAPHYAEYVSRGIARRGIYVDRGWEWNEPAILRAYGAFVRAHMFPAVDLVPSYGVPKRQGGSSAIREAWCEGWDSWFAAAAGGVAALRFSRKGGVLDGEAFLSACLAALDADGGGKPPEGRGPCSPLAWYSLFHRLYSDWGDSFVANLGSYSLGEGGRSMPVPVMLSVWPAEHRVFTALGLCPRVHVRLSRDAVGAPAPVVSWEPNGMPMEDASAWLEMDSAPSFPSPRVCRFREGSRTLDFSRAMSAAEFASLLQTGARKGTWYFRVGIDSSSFDYTWYSGAVRMEVAVPAVTLGPEGGDAVFNGTGGGLKVHVPPGAADEGVQVAVSAIGVDRRAQRERVVGDSVYVIDSTRHEFNRPVSLTFSFDPSTLAGLDPSLLVVKRWDSSSRGWKAVPTSFEKGKVTAVTGRFSTYGVFVDTEPPTVSSLVDSPDPVREGLVLIRVETDESTRVEVEITSPEGMKVASLEDEEWGTSHALSWSVGGEGSTVRPGIYKVSARAVDRAGNVSPVRGCFVHVAPPTGGFVLGGRVTGEAGDGVRVSLLDTTLTTDAGRGGAFRFEGLPAGSYEVEARAPGVFPERLRVEAGPSGTGRGIELELSSRVVSDVRCEPSVVRPAGVGEAALRVALTLERPCNLHVDVVDRRSRVVGVLADGAPHPAGRCVLAWDGLDEMQEPLPSGRYLLRVDASRYGVRLPQARIPLRLDRGLIRTAFADPALFSPDGDGWADETRIDFSLESDAFVEAVVLGDGGVPLRTLLERTMLPASRHVVVWDGRSDAGAFVPDGEYAVRLRAWHPDGLPSWDRTLSVIVDRVVPRITSVSPADGEVITTGMPLIEARVEASPGDIPPGGVKIKLDGDTVMVDEYDPAEGLLRFRPSTSIGEGGHILIVYARDRAGNDAKPAASTFRVRFAPPGTRAAVSATETGTAASDPASSAIRLESGDGRTPFRDTRPPVVRWTTPSDGGVVFGRTPLISLALYDEHSGIDPGTIVLFLDGEQVASSVTRYIPGDTGEDWDMWSYRRWQVLYDPLTGVLRYSPVEPLDMEKGLHRFTIRCVDKAGNPMREHSFSFRVCPDDEPPEVRFVAPEPGHVHRTAGGPRIAFEVKDSGGAGVSLLEGGLVLKLDGERLPVSSLRCADGTTAPSVLSGDGGIVRLDAARDVVAGLPDSSSHLLQLRARDRAGLMSREASLVFSVVRDRTPPIPVWCSGGDPFPALPARVRGADADFVRILDREEPLRILFMDAGGAGIDETSLHVSIDGREVVPDDPSTAAVEGYRLAFSPRGDSRTLEVVIPQSCLSAAGGNGPWNVRLRVADEAGNRGGPWNVEVSAAGSGETPSVRIVSPSDGAVVPGAPLELVVEASRGVLGFVACVDGRWMVPSRTSYDDERGVWMLSLDGVESPDEGGRGGGIHLLSLVGLDASGRPSRPAARVFETSGPVVR